MSVFAIYTGMQSLTGGGIDTSTTLRGADGNIVELATFITWLQREVSQFSLTSGLAAGVPLNQPSR